MIYALYNGLLWLLLVFGWPAIVLLCIFSEKRRRTFWDRLGLRLPEGKFSESGSPGPVWVHALSVGEVLSALPLVKALADRVGRSQVCFSVSTWTGYQTAGEQIAPYVERIFFFPYDLPFSVQRIVAAVYPRVAIIVETDIWPNFLREMKRRNRPVLLVNARLSERSFQGYRRLAGLMGPAIAIFQRIAAPTDQDARRWRDLGVSAERVWRTGNLKYDQPLETKTPADWFRIQNLLGKLSERRMIVAGSTHNGEEENLAEVLERLKADGLDLLLIVAPRDPGRGVTVCRLFTKNGFRAVSLTRAIEAPGESSPEVVVIDRIGLLRRVYGFADLAFIGGSLVPEGGHNPLEAAAFGKPILFGPDMRDFKEIAESLIAAGGARKVEDKDSLYRAISGFFRNPETLREAGRISECVFSENRGAVKKTLELIDPYLDLTQTMENE